VREAVRPLQRYRLGFRNLGKPNKGFNNAVVPKNALLIEEAKNMKSISLVGILLVVLGALALAYQGITYTHREKVLDIGPIHATADKQERIPLPPLLGGLALVGGVVLVFVGARQKA
jgi:hypothetical protein